MPPEIEIDYTIEHGLPEDLTAIEVGTDLGLPMEPVADVGDMPTIKIKPGRPDLAADAAAGALIATRLPIYLRGGALVRPTMEVVDAADGTKTITAKLRDVTLPGLMYILARAAIFQSFDGRKGDFKRVDPPEKTAAMILDGAGDWTFPSVAGVITTPTMRTDGTILSESGYDRQSRLYLVRDPDLVLPPIPEAPTREQALEALQLFKDLLHEFPFVSPVDRAVALSGLLTTVARPALATAPAIAISAHTAGTGKSYLVDVAAALSTGRRCPVIAPGRGEEELEKRLGPLILNSVPIVSIDNIEGELGGIFLCQATERPAVGLRPLGKSEIRTAECRSMFYLTGNNLVLLEDMTRRALMANLDARMERPELREFAGKPFDLVLANRGAYIAAALTILRAYRVAGMPDRLPRLASYEQWSDNVRSTLVWLGEEDPVLTMEKTRKADPVAQAIRQLYAQWEKKIGLHDRRTSASVIATATMADDEELLDLLMRQAGEGKSVSPKRLGKWLSKVAGRIFDGLQLEVENDASNGNRYRLVPVAGAERDQRPAEAIEADQVLIPRPNPLNYWKATRGE
ncbi:hypothetical protein [Methylorubrum populi]|uniref:Uncharacterized protein n=1 Tax=Methylorubrum populi TaxID=223967 RepID=A0A833J6M5_9HYPH|nr:hypothetical protein [Methylorubrum populi]KAB7785377.1 hypothetical protein F8B43_1878 [Methylorubrum populi]